MVTSEKPFPGESETYRYACSTEKISSRFPSNSEAFASELLEKLSSLLTAVCGS